MQFALFAFFFELVPLLADLRACHADKLMASAIMLIKQDTAEKFLKRDLNGCAAKCRGRQGHGAERTSTEYDALVSVAFNAGRGGFIKLASNLCPGCERKAITTGDAAANFFVEKRPSSWYDRNEGRRATRKNCIVPNQPETTMHGLVRWTQPA